MRLWSNRFAVLGLAAGLALGCSESPTSGSASTAVLARPLIGAWSVLVPALEPPPAVPTRDGKHDPDEFLRRALRGYGSKNDFSTRITYRADRTGVIVTTVFGVDRKELFTWGLLSTSPDQMKIDQEASAPPRL